jgi:hypothetical protein
VDLKTTAVPKGIFGLRQVLTWDKAAVRRIDFVAIGTVGAGGGGGPAGPPNLAAAAPGSDEWATSHRTSSRPLVPFRKKDTDKAPDPAPTDLPGPRRGTGGLAAGQGQAAGRTENGLVAVRYTDKTDQARRVPVAIALIVDQDKVALVQTAFANSSLRFLTTQLLVHRYPGTVRPTDTGPPSGDGSATPVSKGPSSFPSYSYGPGMGRGTGGLARFGHPGPAYNPPPTATQATTGGGGEEQEANVELVLYGVVSLYERFPPRRGTESPTK